MVEEISSLSVPDFTTDLCERLYCLQLATKAEARLRKSLIDRLDEKCAIEEGDLAACIEARKEPRPFRESAKHRLGAMYGQVYRSLENKLRRSYSIATLGRGSAPRRYAVLDVRPGEADISQAELAAFVELVHLVRLHQHAQELLVQHFDGEPTVGFGIWQLQLEPRSVKDISEAAFAEVLSPDQMREIRENPVVGPRRHLRVRDANGTPVGWNDPRYAQSSPCS